MSRFLLLISVLLFCGSVIAVNLPEHVVYRIDDRPPSEIFANGFQSYGTNDNVDEHVSGASIRDRSSAWIATTDNIDTASRIGTARFNLNPSLRNRASWVYEIAQTNNMYDFNRTIDNERTRWFLGAEAREHLDALRTVYGPQREIGALRSVLPNQIVRARQFLWDPISGRGQLTGEWTDNPNYNENLYRNTSMNAGLYRFSRSVHYVIGAANTAIFLAASWCLGQGSSKGRSDNQAICGDSELIEYKDTEVLMSQSARTNYFPNEL
ncbi:scabin-related ADP-ribosyltransferase [Enterobacter kobei]|uniref:scabin-related ADP-ribosyltransferase n=1 Tax=Enterobacter kobei TaxID=208224 RepID=UPI003BCCB9EF